MHLCIRLNGNRLNMKSISALSRDAWRGAAQCYPLGSKASQIIFAGMGFLPFFLFFIFNPLKKAEKKGKKRAKKRQKKAEKRQEKEKIM